MRKIYISADIEGIWGNSNPVHTMPGGKLYEEYQNNMINEVNMVIDFLFQNGVQEVCVNDGHGNMDNLLPSRLDSRASFISSNGAYKEFGMMEGLDDSFDGIMMIGYHAKSNTEGVMAHTIWGTMVSKICIDGKEVGEVGVNSLLAHAYRVPILLISGDDEGVMAHTIWGTMVSKICIDGKEVGEVGVNSLLAHAYRVPILLISGDDILEQQIQEELPYAAQFVQTKKAFNNQTALCCSRDELTRRYQNAIQESLKSLEKQMDTDSHVVDITFHKYQNADFVARMPSVQRIDRCTVRLQNQDTISLYKLIRFVIKICNSFM